MVEIFSNGHNQKIGNNVSILNLPPIKTCTNCSTCAKSCYALFRYGYPKIRERWNRNLEMTKLDNFVELATIELRYKATPIVRYHESGDFYSSEYITKCYELALKNPQLKFYGYTKNASALVLNELPNVNVIYSFVNTPIGEVRNYGTDDYCNYLVEHFNTIKCPHNEQWKKEGKKCMIDCQECLTCSSVCFVIHGMRGYKDTYSEETLKKLKESEQVDKENKL